MITKITRDQVREFDTHKYIADASDLGWSPGEWPEWVPTDIGNGKPFLAFSWEYRDGDVEWVTYRQALGCISLNVHND
jgi:hypothetical protein